MTAIVTKHPTTKPAANPATKPAAVKMEAAIASITSPNIADISWYFPPNTADDITDFPNAGLDVRACPLLRCCRSQHRSHDVRHRQWPEDILRCRGLEACAGRAAHAGEADVPRAAWRARFRP